MGMGAGLWRFDERKKGNQLPRRRQPLKWLKNDDCSSFPGGGAMVVGGHTRYSCELFVPYEQWTLESINVYGTTLLQSFDGSNSLVEL